MTIRELIEILQALPPDQSVRFVRVLRDRVRVDGQLIERNSAEAASGPVG